MEFLTDFVITFCFGIYQIYAKTAFWLARIFPNAAGALTKFLFKIYGITVNGPDKKDIQVVRPERFYPRSLAYFEVGLFESFIKGDAKCQDLVQFFVTLLETRRVSYFLHPLRFLLSTLNVQTRKRSWVVGQLHYDIGNDLYEAMLDKNMQYTCAYWRSASNLDEAQLAKMDLIAKKLKLEPGMRVLDMGCGFGTLACHLARNYGVSVVGCTISKEQAKYGQECSKGLEVDIRLCDYRDIDESFDRIVSVGLTEHVGLKNYRDYLKLAHKCLIDDGIFLLHTIGNNHDSVPCVGVGFHKYIFQNSRIPYYLELAKAMEGLWIIEDWHNISYDYSKTLKVWDENFDNAWPTLSKNYDEMFYRKWKLYLAVSRSLFLTRSYQLWQIVLSKDGLRGGYESVR